MQNKKKSGSKAFTQEYFLEKVKDLHSDRYTFDKVEYSGAGQKIIVTCKTHGDFETYASAFLNSEEFSGCPKCRYEKRRALLDKKKEDAQSTAPKKSKLRSLIKVCSKNHLNRYDYSVTEYTGEEETIQVHCPAHGLFEADVVKHKRGHDPCPVCRENRAKHGRRFAEEDYQRRVAENRKASGE